MMINVKYFLIVCTLSIFSNLFASGDTLILSHESGWYESSFLLEASSTVGEIVYEINGTTPTRRSSKWRGSMKVNSTTLIRFGVKYESKIILEKTCLYLVDFESTIPVLSLGTAPANLYDSVRGIYVPGHRAYRDTTKTAVSVFYANANYTQKWERDVQVNYIVPGEGEVIHQAAGLRIFGGLTRHSAEKSLRIIARDEYGDDRFDYPFFPYRDNDSYKHLVIRTSGGDARSTRFRDVLTTQLAKNLNIDIQEFQPVNLFVNGEYWGVYNLRERLGQHYLQSNFGADKDTSNLLQGRGAVDHGSGARYRELLAFLRAHTFSDGALYDSLGQLMDIQNFRDFQVAQIYTGNIDYMGNIRYWQSDDVSSQFRWIMYDTDLGFGHGVPARWNFIAERLSSRQTKWYNPNWSTFILRKLMENTSFKYEFINQVCYAMSIAYSSDNANRLIDSLADVYRPEMARHFQRNGGSVKRWEAAVQSLRNFADERPAYYLKHTGQLFTLTDPYILHLTVDGREHGRVSINKNVFADSALIGQFFSSVPLEVIVDTDPLYIVNTPSRDTIWHAEGDTIHYSITFSFVGNSPLHGQVKINEVGGLTDGKDSVWIELVNLDTQSVTLSGWSFISKKGRHTIDSFTIDLFGLLQHEEGAMDAPVGIRHKISGKSDFVYLVDDNGLLVDSISWRHAKDSIPFGYERPHPKDDFIALSVGGGSPLDYNSNHRPDSGSDAEGSGKRGWVVFFVLILLIMASLGLAWKKQWLTLPIKQ